MNNRARFRQQHHQGWNGSGGYGGFDNRRWSDWHSGESAWSWGGAWGSAWDGGTSAEPGWGGGDWAGGSHAGFSGQDWSGYMPEATYAGYHEMDPALALSSVEVPTPDTGVTGVSSLAPSAGGGRFGSQVDRHYQQDEYEDWDSERRYPHSGPRFIKRPMMVPSSAGDDSADLREGASALQLPSSSSKAPATTIEDAQSSKWESSAPPRRRKPHDRQPGRLWCHIFLHKGHNEFDLVPMLIGKGGCNMREIYQKSHCKIRVRGRGSGHLEVDGKKEAPVPLMVAVTANVTDSEGFKLAIQMTLARLKTVDDNFLTFCQSRGLQAPTQRLFSIGELSKGAEHVLGEALRDSGRMLPLHCADEGYSGAGYDNLAACLCSSPWASFRVKNAVHMAAHGTPARVPLRPEVQEFGAGMSGSEEDEEVELPELISSQVSAFLQADASDYANLDS